MKENYPGSRCLLVFCAQHSGVERVCPAADIDPIYAAELIDAHAAGVEVYALGCDIDVAGNQMSANRLLPVLLEPLA